MREDSLQILYRLKPKVRSAFTAEESMQIRIDEIEKRMVVGTTPIANWLCRTCKYHSYNNYEYLEEWRKAELGTRWGGDDITGFFKTTVPLPGEIFGTNMFLDISVGGEALLSINGKPYQGLDFDRQMVPLMDYFKEGQDIEILIEASVRNAPYDSFRDDIRIHHVFEKANIIQINKQIEDLYYDCWLIYGIAKEMVQGEYHDFLLENLEIALQQVDLYEKDLDSFLTGVAKAKKLIEENIYKNESFKKNGKICLVGQSHLDLVYLWPYKEFLRKNPRTAMNMVRMLEEFPEFRFSQSQGKLYSELKEKYPSVYSEVKEKIKDGKWEPVGAFYVEPDCNLPSGESIIRQIIFGKKYYREEFGNDPEICWIPDVFGCMWTMPQILIKSGVKYLSTIKLSIWNDTNPFPYNSFWWEGPDGSKVLAHFPTTHFVASVEPKKIQENWDNYKEKHITGESMYQFGLADGGGGATRDMVARMLRIRKFPGMPEMEFDSIIHFFRRLEDKSEKLPVWQDELYLETHRGTYTTKGQIKKANRKAEFLLRDAELYSVIAKQYGGASRKNELDEAWEKVLVNQFHDIIPGSHVNEVVDEAMELYEKAFEIGKKVKEESLRLISQNISIGYEENILVFNSLSWKRTGMVEIEWTKNSMDFSIIDAENGSVLSYTMEKSEQGRCRLYCRVQEVPAMGYKVLNIVQNTPEALPARATIESRTVDTPQFKVVIGENGTFTSIYDKVYHRELVEGGEANKFQIFEDKPGRYSAWDIIPSYEDYEFTDIELEDFVVLENNYVRTVLSMRVRVLDSIVIQKIVFNHDVHRIDFETTIDWKEREKLLKVGFPVAIHSRNATYDIPFGTIQRPTHRSTSWDRAKFEVCAHKWADLSEGNFGITLLNDCKYGYDIRGNLMRLTLLKAPVFPDPVSDVGIHEFKYSIYPHTGDWREGSVMQEGYNFNIPFDAVLTGRQEGALNNKRLSWINVPDNNIIVETVKEPETGDNGIIIRAYDVIGQRCEFRLETEIHMTGAVEVDLMEKEIGNVEMCGNALALTIKPYEIKTVKLI